MTAMSSSHYVFLVAAVFAHFSRVHKSLCNGLQITFRSLPNPFSINRPSLLVVVVVVWGAQGPVVVVVVWAQGLVVVVWGGPGVSTQLLS